MTPERWTRIQDLLALALQRPAAERRMVLAGADVEEDVRAEVEDLLESERQMGAFLAEPLWGSEPVPADAGIPAALLAWDRYEILELLGSGGMATVYKARDPRLNRLLAIKVISGSDDRTVRRFLREAEAQARVDHDAVLKVFETGSVGAHYYIAMQYVDGPTLLGVRGETTPRVKAQLMRQIAEGLHEAHRRGLVHRDIKPGNILVERGRDGVRPYLMDFGLATDIAAPGLTQTGVVMGTPRYMPPERIRGGPAALDQRSDLYSLGATFYEFLSGTPLFAEVSGLDVLGRILDDEAAPLRRLQRGAPAELDAIIAKCLEKDPQRRYASARELADDLQRYVDGEPVLARPIGAIGRLARKARRHPRQAAAFLAMALAIGVATGSAAYGSWRTARQTALAQQLGQEVRDLEWMFRVAQMAPVHNLEPEKRQVRDRIARLQTTIEQVGAIAVGPGHYAIGRGFLALGAAPQALEHLQLAWAAGYRTADAAMALGLAHGAIFREELDKAERIAVEHERARRIRDLESTHRDPALRYLQQGRSSAIVPSRYADALIASHQGARAEAVAGATEAARETPWLFEAPLLAGDVEFAEAVRRYLTGQLTEARVHAAEADRHYAEAQRIGASSIGAYLGRCAVAGLVLHMMMHQLQGDPLPVYRRAEDACPRAIALEPGNSDAHRLYSDAVRAWAGVNVLAERDPGDAYDRATRLVERAIELSGTAVETLLVLGDTFLDRAWAENRRGRDPRAALDRAVETFEQIQRVDPRNATALNNLGQAFLLRSRYEAARALDSLESLERAVASFLAALAIDPSLVAPIRNLARTAVARADEQRRLGVDPDRGLRNVLDALERVLDRASPDRTAAVAQLRARLTPPLTHGPSATPTASRRRARTDDPAAPIRR